MSEEIKTKVKLDGGGYACNNGNLFNSRSYLWIGTDSTCFTYATSLRSLRGLRDLCDQLIKARSAPPKKPREFQ